MCEAKEDQEVAVRVPGKSRDVQTTLLNSYSDAEGSRTTRLKDFKQDVDSSSDLEKEKENRIEAVVSPPPSSTTSRAGSQSNDSDPPRREGTTKKIIRFGDGDPDNPDNWRQVSRMPVSDFHTLM